MTKIIEIQDLHKSYGETESVKGINLHVKVGDLYAFLGPNGAGKSTTIDMICTFLTPDSGRITVDGHEVGKEDAAIRETIGVVFQGSVLDAELTVEENLLLRGQLYGLSKQTLKHAVQQALERTQSSEFKDQKYGQLSGGQRRRADIARALIHDPKILFLDEPTTGLDPKARQMVWQTIMQMKAEQGMTIFLTTHYMEEAANADFITIMDHGAVIADGTPTALKDQYAKNVLKLSGNYLTKITQQLEALGVPYDMQVDQIIVKLDYTKDALSVLDRVRQYITSFEVVKGSMDDVFLEITGRELN